MLSDNREQDIAVVDPETQTERAVVASTCALELRTRIPIAIDGVDDRVALAYGGWPDRLYLIGRDGRIAFQGGEGPFGFVPAELAAAIEAEAASR